MRFHADVEDRLLAQQIGATVMSLRKRRKLTVRRLAIRSGVHVNTIYRIECGSLCSVINLWKVARGLGVRVADLIPDIQ